MRNFENNYGGQTNSENTGWELVGDNEEPMADDDIEQRQAEREAEFKQRQAERKARRERMRSYEQAEAIMRNKVLALVGSALATLALFGAILGGGCSTHEIMDRHPNMVDTLQVQSVTLVDGPNIRRDPSIPIRENGSNIIMDSGEEGQEMHIPYEGIAYHFDNQADPDGGWYGFPANEFSNELYTNGFIGKNEAEQLVKKDEDGVVWFNDKYVKVVAKNTDTKVGSISNTSGS